LAPPSAPPTIMPPPGAPPMVTAQPVAALASEEDDNSLVVMIAAAAGATVVVAFLVAMWYKRSFARAKMQPTSLTLPTDSSESGGRTSNGEGKKSLKPLALATTTKPGDSSLTESGTMSPQGLSERDVTPNLPTSRFGDGLGSDRQYGAPGVLPSDRQHGPPGVLASDRQYAPPGALASDRSYGSPEPLITADGVNSKTGSLMLEDDAIFVQAVAVTAPLGSDPLYGSTAGTNRHDNIDRISEMSPRGKPVRV